MFTCTGVTDYEAPEMIRGDAYTHAVDLWLFYDTTPLYALIHVSFYYMHRYMYCYIYMHQYLYCYIIWINTYICILIFFIY